MDTEAATGPPERMVETREELTPMLSQYLDLCEAYGDTLVLFQVGDFYEAFCEAAEVTARVCEVTLTKREDSTGSYPMAGIPIENAASYVEKLLDAGLRVAVADQVEDAEEASGLVDRAVTQVVTPGTVVEDELLEAGTTNYVACVVRGAEAGADDGSETDGGATTAGNSDGSGDERYALAVVDVSTGDCLVTSAAGRARIVEELERLTPSELLVEPGLPLPDLDFEAMRTDYDPAAFEPEAARERLAAYVARPEAVVGDDAELRAAGALLAYAEYTQGDERLEYVSRVTRYDPRDYLLLDATALRSLELFESRNGRAGGTLLEVLDDTACALGRRRLTEWLRRPLVDRAGIAARLDAVAEWTERSVARESIRDLLTDVYDVERLVARVSRGRANARDLRSLKATLDVVPEVKEAMADVESGRLVDLRAALDEMADVRDLIDRAVAPDPPQEITEGGVIREGFDGTLDDLRATEQEGRAWVADLEASERERTGIDSLDVGYNQVHGYYIEVTNPNLDRVPDDYTRRQTLKNSERFYTPELKRREDEILGASERADAREYDLFREVRADVAAEAERVQALADALADLDVLTTLAAVAVENDYVRPAFGNAGIDIDGGRHPVVERTTEFVPNGIDLTEGRVAVITGPNMSGKSTYMRQVALVVVMAQMGGFVPAEAARLPVVDRVFTRVGASDDIAGGQSTFMREMSELTDILHHATDNSLVLLDEVGRGTSTADGLAIARATTEFIHDEVGAATLFATHYHDLTALADSLGGVFNLHFTASRDADADRGTEADGVTFLHRVAEGPSSSSYGVEVARMAGVPEAVVDRSRALVAEGAPTVRTDGADDGGDDATDRTEAAVESGIRAGNQHRPDELDRKDDERDRQGMDGRAHEPTADAPDDARRNGTLTEYVDGAPAAAGADRSVPAEDADVLAAVARDLRNVDVAGTTPLEALNLLNDLKKRLDDADTGTR